MLPFVLLLSNLMTDTPKPLDDAKPRTAPIEQPVLDALEKVALRYQLAEANMRIAQREMQDMQAENEALRKRACGKFAACDIDVRTKTVIEKK